MRTTLALLILPLLSGCLLPGELFYSGQLSEHDQAIFRAAARIEGVEVVDWPVPGAWIVVYGAPLHDNATTFPGVVFIDKDQITVGIECPRDQLFLVSARHEIRHSEGTLEHSTMLLSVMHDPAPCYPND